MVVRQSWRGLVDATAVSGAAADATGVLSCVLQLSSSEDESTMYMIKYIYCLRPAVSTAYLQYP
jgi:hypothetical protein